MNARQLKPSTIFAHLAEAIEEGELRLEDVTSLREDEIRHIKNLILAQPKEEQRKLKPVFEQLQGAYDYNILRCIAADLRRKNNHEEDPDF